MRPLRAHEDAFGEEIRAAFTDPDAQEIIERDDGRIEAYSAQYMFARFANWPAHQKVSLAYARGRVLDVGAGAGRVSLELQKRKHAVVAIDNSPLAVKVMKKRGVKDARVIALGDVDGRLGMFDTVVMYGNNFGLVGSPARAKRLLRRLAKLTPTPGARILAESLDPHRTKDPQHLAYHRRNRRRGRAVGLVRIRARFRSAATPWIDLLLVSPDELRKIVRDTGWRVERIVRGNPTFVAVLVK